MPQIRIRGIETEKVIEISKAMTDELEDIIKCPRNYFVIECIGSTFVMDGEITTGYPIIEISWFDRGQIVQDKVAQVVTKYIQYIGYINVDIIFKVLEESGYYENGVHF